MMGMIHRGILPLALFLALVPVSPITAQEGDDCGVGCDGCAVGAVMREAKFPPTGAPNESLKSMSCGIGCRPCGGGIKEVICELLPFLCRVGETAPSAEDIADVISLANPTIHELRKVVANHRHRLLLDVNRRLVGIRGVGCTANAVVTVLVVDAQTAGRLADLGVESLDRFLSPPPSPPSSIPPSSPTQELPQ